MLGEIQIWGSKIEDVNWDSRTKRPFYLALINRAGGLYGRILSEVASTNRTQWGLYQRPRSRINGTFQLQGADPSHRAFGYCFCTQDSKERSWGQQFCQTEGNISVGPTEMIRLVKVDHLQCWSQIFRSDRTEMVRSIWFLNKISGILGWMESALRLLLCT